MKSIFHKKVISFTLVMQMMLMIIPQGIISAGAEVYTYMHEDFSGGMSAWTDNNSNASVVTADGYNYLEFKLSGTDAEVYRDMPKGVALSENDVYVVEFDVRFENEASGEVLVYGRNNKLGPTLSYDGSVIKAQTGSNAYVTMRTNASAGKWYNVKLLANGLKTVYSYTTDIEGKNTTEASSKSVARNMTVAPFGRISLKGNGKSGAVNIRDIKVYKPAPTQVHIGVDGNVEKVSVPATGTTRTINYLAASTEYNGVDFSQYQPLANGLVKFELYDSTDTENLTDNMPDGITLGSESGTLTVSDSAQVGEYYVRLCSYDGAVYDSRKITIVEAGEMETIKLDKSIERLPVPSNGTVKTTFKAQGYDDTGSEVYNKPFKWTLLDVDGNVLNDQGIVIDESTGVVSTTSEAMADKIKVKVESQDNPDVYAISKEITVYKMTAKNILINGSDYIQLSASEDVSETYTAQILDQYGAEMPQEEITEWGVTGSDSVSIDNGVLAVEAGANDSVVTVTISAGDVTASKKVTVYSPILNKISVDGDRTIEIPKSGTKAFAYTAKAYDQNGFEIKDIDFLWSMNTYDSTALSMSGATVMAGIGAKEQTITVTASSADIKGGLKVVVTENPFTYKPVDGGFEIDNGKKNYTRPIYSPHMNDDLLGVNGKKSTRFIYYLGDQPKLVLTSVGTNVYKRYAHMFIGIKGGKWLDEMKNITARYVNGHEEYEITDSSFEGKIKLTYTRSDKLDAMLVKAELPDSIKDKLVVVTAGEDGAAGSQPTEGKSTSLEFLASDTATSTISIDNNTYHISGNTDISMNGTASIPMNYTVKDAAMYEVGVDALLNSSATVQPMVVGTTEGNTENEIYWLLTTEPTENQYINEFKTNAKEIFDDGINYYKSVSETVKIDTPDPYLNAAITSQMMATDASWDWPSITHGPMGWHVAFGGWRSHYGFVDAGWGDRIKTNAKQFMKTQSENGRIWVYPNVDNRYNMSIVLIDGLLQYWEWSGDNEFFANEGGYDFVAGHLRFMDSYMQVSGTNLYENWLDAWNTDNKWNNGSAGSIATAYTWRAYNTMAKLAKKLGKSEDAALYRAKADTIKSEMNEELWDKDTGVFGEYRERFGQGRLNTAPDLSSVYTPIDMGMATYEQEYQMLRFTDYAVPSVANQDSIWQGIDFKYSSNRPPEYYSSQGLYIQEVINNALAYFENGQRDMAMKQLRACLVPMMKGSAAGQGTASHIVRASLENKGHIDFADTSTQYVRTAVEGLFGIKMNVPDSIADITPGMPEDWKYASISTNYLSYDYKYENNTDIYNISSEKELSYAMHIPTRSSKIESVKVNGAHVDYTVDNFVNLTTPVSNSSVIEVKYAEGEIAMVEADEIGGVNAEYTVKSNGTITAISDPQGVTTNVKGIGTDTIVATLGEKEGNHTFFVTVEKNDMTAVLPIDLVINETVEITDMSIVSGDKAGINLKLKNNTEKAVSVNAVLSTISGSIATVVTIPTKSTSSTIFVPVKKASDLTPGNNKVTVVLTGDVNTTVTAEVTDWQLLDKITNNSEQFVTVSLDGVVNQDLRTLHENSYDLTYEGDENYRLPNFYWSSDTPRTVLDNGRSWWETGRGANGVPVKLNLPADGGIYTTDIGVPFDISSTGGNNSAFVSLYNQFPNKINIPVNVDGSKIYFMLSVSTNNMQSRIENARITINMKDGTKEVLPLTNPDNIDDWLNYQMANPYAESGYVQMLDSLAHSNILAVDLGTVKQIESVDFECLASEVLAGLLGITVVEGEYEEPSDELSLGEVTFDSDNTNTALITIVNNTESDVNADIIIAHYAKDGSLKFVSKKGQLIKNGTESYNIPYISTAKEDGDYVKVFLWDNTKTMKPFTVCVEKTL